MTLPTTAALDAGESKSASDSILSWMPDVCQWAVLTLQPVAGMPVYTVRFQHRDRATVERLAGWHDSPITSWLVADGEGLGWRLASGHGWTAEPGPLNRHSQALALSKVFSDQGLVLFVERASGRLTMPDIVA